MISSRGGEGTITRSFSLQIFRNEVQSRELSTFELSHAIVSAFAPPQIPLPPFSLLAHRHALTREQDETLPADIPGNSFIPSRILTRHHVRPGFSARLNNRGSLPDHGQPVKATPRYQRPMKMIEILFLARFSCF